MQANTNEQNSKKKRVGAGVASAGGGTLLIAIANNLPNESPWKALLLFVAPTVTVIFGTLITEATLLIKGYFRQQMIHKEVANTKNIISSCLSNPDTSDTHKDEMRKKLENIEKLDVDNKLNYVSQLLDIEKSMLNKQINLSGK